MSASSVIYKPRTGEEVLKAAPPQTSLYTYSDLCNIPLPAKEIILGMDRHNIILLQDPDKMSSGHWVSLSVYPEIRKAYFFSSYGGKPDKEKNEWITKKKLAESHQLRNVLNDGLKELAKEGWEIHYNDHPYQKVGDKTATCGIWATAFLNSGENPDEFEEDHKSVLDYYRELFS